MIGFSSSGTEVWGLAEVLSISFLCFSTHTSVKKTEMNQNATFPAINAMNVVPVITISIANNLNEPKGTSLKFVSNTLVLQ